MSKIDLTKILVDAGEASKGPWWREPDWGRVWDRSFDEGRHALIADTTGDNAVHIANMDPPTTRALASALIEVGEYTAQHDDHEGVSDGIRAILDKHELKVGGE